jgi:hypothetical protein
VFRRRRLLSIVALAVLAVALTLVWFSPLGWTVWGRLRGEPFFRGRPASQWARELEEYCPAVRLSDDLSRVHRRYYRYTDGLLGELKGQAGVRRAVVPIGMQELPFADGDPNGVPVLIALLEHAKVTIRQMAAWGLARCGPAARDAIPALERARQQAPDCARWGICVDLDEAIVAIEYPHLKRRPTVEE